jgi:hypothetical protein
MLQFEFLKHKNSIASLNKNLKDYIKLFASARNDWWKKMEPKYLLWIVHTLHQVHWLFFQPVTEPYNRISNLLIYELLKDEINKRIKVYLSWISMSYRSTLIAL